MYNQIELLKKKKDRLF